MKLYFAPGACSLSPHIILREAGVPFELKKVDLGSKAIEGGGNYAEINPKGYVPALELSNGEVLTEGPAIVQYVADQNPASNLAPKNGTLERYRLQEWLNFITSELHKNFGALFQKTISEDWKKAALNNIDRRLSFVAEKLEGKQFLLGEQFSVADAYLFTVLGWSSHLNIDLSKWPALVDYSKRIGARPKVQEAMRAEGLLK